MCKRCCGQAVGASKLLVAHLLRRHLLPGVDINRLDVLIFILYVHVMFNSANHLDSALSRTRDALARIVAMLAALVGLASGKPGEVIAKTVRLQVLRILRPAEAAVRRLIFVAAQGVEIKPSTPMPAGVFATLRRGASPSEAKRAAPPRFQLADPMVPMISPHRSYYDSVAGNVAFVKRMPRVRFVAPIDPTIPALFAAKAPARQKPDADTVRSAALIRRLQAITFALETIPRQAKRLARWTARRARMAEKRPVYTSPLRPGLPPGYRKEPEHEVDRILAACHLRAFDARLKVNTS
jgi:hypothetical protein